MSGNAVDGRTNDESEEQRGEDPLPTYDEVVGASRQKEQPWIGFTPEVMFGPYLEGEREENSTREQTEVEVEPSDGSSSPNSYPRMMEFENDYSFDGVMIQISKKQAIERELTRIVQAGRNRYDPAVHRVATAVLEEINKAKKKRREKAARAILLLPFLLIIGCLFVYYKALRHLSTS